MAGEEILDWELVHGSDTDSIASEKESSVIDNGMIVSDHFSADHPTTDQITGSGDSSRVGYGSEDPNPVGSGFDQLDVYQSGDGVGNELGFIDGEIKEIGFQASDVEEHVGDASKCLSETDHLQVGVEEHVEDASKSLSESEVGADSEAVEGSGGDVVGVDSAVRSSGDESKSRETVWWKMPFVLVKYYAFRIGPVWSVSMAAAVMGFVLLGRRLYHMKKKAQRFHLKVAIDEKKVSRVMSQAARLNEAFSEVRRVPAIRPALPSPAAWPVLSLR